MATPQEGHHNHLSSLISTCSWMEISEINGNQIDVMCFGRLKKLFFGMTSEGTGALSVPAPANRGRQVFESPGKMDFKQRKKISGNQTVYLWWSDSKIEKVKWC